MTEATPLASEQITQEDREAAWKYRPACYWVGGDTMKKWMNGAYDTAASVITDFARHRIAALSASPAPSGQGVSGEVLPPNAVDDQGFSDAECNAVLIDGYARDADRRGWRATGDALRRAAGFIRGYDALTAKAAPAPSCAPGEVERLLAEVKTAARYVAVGDGYFDLYATAADAVDAAVDRLAAALSPQGLDAKEGGE